MSGAGPLERLVDIDWNQRLAELGAQGHTVLERLLDRDQCVSLRGLYDDAAVFRSRVIMARHGFGQGEYQYFNYPLPGLVQDLRRALYPSLVGTANRWNEALGRSCQFPESHAEFLQLCRAAGQNRPTPLLLRYASGDYNCLHQDVYGEWVFPLQVAVLLSEPQQEFTGGEFVLTEQRPRMQSRPQVVPLCQGDAVVFAVSHRPVQGIRGIYRVNMRHGVSRIRSGARFTAGIIFHDAAASAA